MTTAYPDPKNPDMSPEAIDQRFRMVEALRKLGVPLKEAGEQARRQETQADIIPSGATGESSK